jgi:hypothetical protein
VKIFDRDGTLVASFLAYDSAFHGGVRVAVGDINNDGVNEVITAPGAGTAPVIKVFSRRGREIVDSFKALDGKFTGGVYVSALNWDGLNGDEVVVSVGAGGGPQIEIYNPNNARRMTNFFAYDTQFHGGVRTARVQSTERDNDVLVTVPLTGVVEVRRFSRDSEYGVTKQLGSFNGFVANYGGGAAVAGGNVNLTSTDRIIVGTQGGRQATVNIYTSTGGTLLHTLYPFGPFTGAINIATGWVY